MSVEFETTRTNAAILPTPGLGPGGALADRAGRLEWWAAQVGRVLGLHFPPMRWGHLERGLAARMRLFGLESFDAYRDLILARPVEWRGLADALTVRETAFFREPAVMRALANDSLPEILAARSRAGEPRLRIWSAGCSTGEEAYSLAIIASEVTGQSPLWTVEVLGTDLSQGAIRVAREGVYRTSRLGTLPGELVERYFEQVPAGERGTTGARRRVTRTVRGQVRFSVHNLVGAPWPATSFDVILCQNVLMYLCPDQRRRVLQRLFQSLSAPGYLLIGPADMPAEPLFGGARPLNAGGALAYRRT